MSGLHEFLSKFMMDIDFSFDFGAKFSRFSKSGDDSSGLYEYDGVSCGFSIEAFAAGRRCRHQRRRPHRPNRHHHIQSVLTSCWYINFLEPGQTCDMTHNLSSSDRFGKFCHWFRMSLAKVEELTCRLIARGYIQHPRSLMHRDEFFDDVCTFWAMGRISAR